MTPFKTAFIDFLLEQQALQFGEFTLKSGRKSPYFFNLGAFNTGQSLEKLGFFYASLLEEKKLRYDLLFGPAYKGISLVTATSIALSHHYQKNVPYCFNRKEIKTHGDQGQLVGAPLTGNVIMLDDVVTAGTTIQETLALLEQYQNAKLSAIIIAFDRQEKVALDISIPLYSLINLNDLIDYLSKKEYPKALLEAILRYQSQFSR